MTTVRVWESVPLEIVTAPWWSLNWDTNGEYAEMGHTLPCGHDIRVRSRTTNSNLRRQFRRAKAHHETRCEP